MDSYAQDSISQNNQHISYFNALYSGGLFGKSERGVTASFSLVNGVRYQRISAGIGMGYDDYTRSVGEYYGSYFLRWKTLPVFLSLSYDFARVKQNSFYVQLNGGHSFMWASLPGEYLSLENVKGGVMINPLVGYRVSATGYSLYFSAGYKWQKNKYTQTYPDWSGINELEVTEILERFVIQIGFGLH